MFFAGPCFDQAMSLNPHEHIGFYRVSAIELREAGCSKDSSAATAAIPGARFELEGWAICEVRLEVCQAYLCRLPSKVVEMKKVDVRIPNQRPGSASRLRTAARGRTDAVNSERRRVPLPGKPATDAQRRGTVEPTSAVPSKLSEGG